VKPEKIRELAPAEIHAKEKELQEQLFKLRIQKGIGQIDNPGKIKEARREIARLKTILREKNA
jgi:large subunit ribosomal protein L29